MRASSPRSEVERPVRVVRLDAAFASLLSFLGVAGGCSDWRTHVTRGSAVDAPEQEGTDEDPIHLTIGGKKFTLIPRASYATRAWVVATDDDFDDGLEAVMSQDVALAWGPVGDPKVLGQMKFHLKRRYVSVRWTGDVGLSETQIMGHLSNHHLIASKPEIASYLEHVKEGDLLTMEGLLVDVQTGDRTVRTSLRRDDIGNGACEILWVESVKIDRPPS